MASTNESTQAAPFGKDLLQLDAEQETQRICDALRAMVHHQLRRQGGVVGLSGGVDSAVVAALAVRALGAERVIGVLLPEKESSPESETLALEFAAGLGIQTIREDITAALQGFGCYERRDEAVRRVFPQYQPGWPVKIVLPANLLEQGGLNIFQLVIEDPLEGEQRQRLPLQAYYQIVAASNLKQRTRTNLLYYHAELRNFAVLGTPNKNEHDLGFFVKFGDGGYDFAPIRHLYKTQVYQLAEYLGVPQSIRVRPPTTDTYPGGGTQEEFFYRIPFAVLDTIWAAYEQNLPAAEIAAGLSLQPKQVEQVIDDIARKKKTTTYLRSGPAGIEDKENSGWEK